MKARAEKTLEQVPNYTLRRLKAVEQKREPSRERQERTQRGEPPRAPRDHPLPHPAEGFNHILGKEALELPPNLAV